MKHLLLTLALATTALTALAKDTETIKTYNNSIETTFLSWFTGSVKIYYEHAFTHRHAIDTALGIIGIAYDGKKNDPKGWLARAGYKYNIALCNPSKPLQGLYLKPELLLSTFNYNNKTTNLRQRSTMTTLMGNIGYQHTWNRIIIDLYWGIGAAWGTEADTRYEHGCMLWDMLGLKCKQLSVGSGIKLGLTL